MSLVPFLRTESMMNIALQIDMKIEALLPMPMYVFMNEQNIHTKSWAR